MTQEEADGTVVFAETFHAFRDVSADASAAAVGDSTRLDASPLPRRREPRKKSSTSRTTDATSGGTSRDESREARVPVSE